MEPHEPSASPPSEPDATPPPPGPPRCPNCGAEHELDQEYCLECGQRLPAPSAPPGYRRTTEIWSRDSPAWLWATLLALLLVALVAGAIALALGDGNDEAAGQPVVTANTATTETVGTITNTNPITLSTSSKTDSVETILPTGPTTVSVPTLTTGATNTTKTTTSSSGVRAWPPGKDGFTIVLASVPTSHGRAAADRKAEGAIANGLPDVGVLNSSDYISLNPGYYVVFTGVYDSKGQAESHLATARSFQPLAYVREVTP